MEKVFLLMKYYLESDGKMAFPKFDYQISALKSMGFSVYFLGIRNDNIYLCHDDEEIEVFRIKKTKMPGLSTFLIYDGIYKATQKVLASSLRFDVAYIRAMPTTLSYAKALENLKKVGCKVVIEIPTYPFEKEIDAERRVFRKLYFNFSNKYLINKSLHVDLFALIGESSKIFAGKPAINIENGISLEKIPLRTQKNNDGMIHILGLANMAKWHGYDRVIEGLREYKESGGTKNLVLHLVGSDGDGSLLKWKKMTKKYKMEEIVIFEGPQYGESLRWYFDNCQIAIGSIGLHRTGFSSAATLKAREYMARGLPFILSTEDQSIAYKENFYMQIPSNDSPVNIEKLIHFAEQSMMDGEIPNRMREYAAKKMTWVYQFSKVFNSLKRL